MKHKGNCPLTISHLFNGDERCLKTCQLHRKCDDSIAQKCDELPNMLPIATKMQILILPSKQMG